MGTIYRSDVDAVAAAYLKNRVNNNINPYHSGWAPGWVDMSKVGNFSLDPGESHPGNGLNGTITGGTFRQLMINMGVYYGWIGRGHYGLFTSNQLGFYYQFEGVAYFVLNGNAAGANDHFNRVNNDLNTAGTPGGGVQYQQAIDFYDFAWNIINNRKDDVEADLTVCHSSCHGSCHGSRGRR